jgi:acyltransferase
MVVGHTLDALLAPAVRLEPAVVAYWKARGLTAPLFMLVSGWAVTAALRRSGGAGPRLLAGRLPRVALLLAIGLALRFPGWDQAGLVAGATEPWAHLLGFDALHVIAVGLLVTAAVQALGRPLREERLWFALLVVLAVSLGLRPPAPLQGRLPAALPALAVTQALGGSSPFPLVPWTGYFFAGALLGLLVLDGSPRTAPRMAAGGAALVAATCWQGIGTAPPGEPALIAFRIGVILLVLAVLWQVPAASAARVAPLGRLSLWVYALHVPLVYGWSTIPGLSWRIGPVLGFPAAAAAAAAVLLASLAAAAILSGGWRRLKRLAGEQRVRLLGRGGAPA